MIDIQNEKLVRLQRVPKLLPPNERTGRLIHISAIYRWVQAGRLSVDGQRIQLETTKIGGSTLTSIEALQRFADQLANAEPAAERCSNDVAERTQIKVEQILGLARDSS